MTYIFLYRSKNSLLTEEQKKESRQVWDTWNSYLKETNGIRTAIGKVVTSDTVVDYNGNRCKMILLQNCRLKLQFSFITALMMK